MLLGSPLILVGIGGGGLELVEVMSHHLFEVVVVSVAATYGVVEVLLLLTFLYQLDATSKVALLLVLVVALHPSIVENALCLTFVKHGVANVQLLLHARGGHAALNIVAALELVGFDGHKAKNSDECAQHKCANLILVHNYPLNRVAVGLSD